MDTVLPPAIRGPSAGGADAGHIAGNAAGSGSLVRLNLEQVTVPAGEPGIYLIYADAQSAAQNAGSGSPGYLGYTADRTSR